MYIGRGLNVVIVANSQDIAAKMMKSVISYYELLDGARTIMSNQRMACTARYDTPIDKSIVDIRRSGQFNMVRACSCKNLNTHENYLFLYFFLLI